MSTQELKKHLDTITRFLDGKEVLLCEFKPTLEAVQGILVAIINRWARAGNVLPPIGKEVLAVQGDRMFVAHRLKDGWHDESGKMVTPDYWQVVAKPD